MRNNPNNPKRAAYTPLYGPRPYSGYGAYNGPRYYGPNYNPSPFYGPNYYPRFGPSPFNFRAPLHPAFTHLQNVNWSQRGTLPYLNTYYRNWPQAHFWPGHLNAALNNPYQHNIWPATNLLLGGARYPVMQSYGRLTPYPGLAGIQRTQLLQMFPPHSQLWQHYQRTNPGFKYLSLNKPPPIAEQLGLVPPRDPRDPRGLQQLPQFPFGPPNGPLEQSLALRPRTTVQRITDSIGSMLGLRPDLAEPEQNVRLPGLPEQGERQQAQALLLNIRQEIGAFAQSRRNIPQPIQRMIGVAIATIDESMQNPALNMEHALSTQRFWLTIADLAQGPRPEAGAPPPNGEQDETQVKTGADERVKKIREGTQKDEKEHQEKQKEVVDSRRQSRERLADFDECNASRAGNTVTLQAKVTLANPGYSARLVRVGSEGGVPVFEMRSTPPPPGRMIIQVIVNRTVRGSFRDSSENTTVIVIDTRGRHEIPIVTREPNNGQPPNDEADQSEAKANERVKKIGEIERRTKVQPEIDIEGAERLIPARLRAQLAQAKKEYEAARTTWITATSARQPADLRYDRAYEAIRKQYFRTSEKYYEAYYEAYRSMGPDTSRVLETPESRAWFEQNIVPQAERRFAENETEKSRLNAILQREFEDVAEKLRVMFPTCIVLVEAMSSGSKGIGVQANDKRLDFVWDDATETMRVGIWRGSIPAGGGISLPMVNFVEYGKIGFFDDLDGFASSIEKHLGVVRSG